MRIVFSKDRALQLDAFLRSYKDYVEFLDHIYVLYLATTSAHEKAYEELFNRTPWAIPIRQTNFRFDLLKLLSQTSYESLVFFVDDQIFIRPWDGFEMIDLSLRLGKNINYCYTLNTPQPLPPFQKFGSNFLIWKWSEGEYDWRYPLSLDGHIFYLEKIKGLINSLEFDSPNTLESALQVYLPEFLERQGLCYHESRVVNIPWTRVQTDYDNRSMGLNTKELLTIWDTGFQIKLDQFKDVINTGVHQEFPLILERRL